MAASKRLRVLALAAAFVLLAAAPAAAQATWTQVPSPNRPGSNELQGAASADASHVWAVGRVVSTSGSPATYRSLILRWNGSAWAADAHPRFARNHALRGVAAPAADDAWAVGTRQVASGGLVTLVERWDGASWRSVPIPQPSPIMLFGVEALAPNDVWAVGHTYLGGPHWIPLVLHWNGTAWGRATIPAFPSGGQLRDVVALSPSNVYAVGLDGEGFNARPLVLHWNGASWTRQAPPNPPGGPKLYGAAAIGPSIVWGVGYHYDQGLAANQTFTIRTTNG